MRVDDRSSDLRRLRDLRHGDPGEFFDHIRRIEALIGTLRDLTEILRLTSQEEGHADPDPLWPFEDYAPFIMGPTLHWMSIVTRRARLPERIDADVDVIARETVTCWGKPASEAERILAMGATMGGGGEGVHPGQLEQAERVVGCIRAGAARE